MLRPLPLLLLGLIGFRPCKQRMDTMNITKVILGGACNFTSLLLVTAVILYCHTRLHLGFSVPACKMEPRSGIIFCKNPTRPDRPDSTTQFSLRTYILPHSAPSRILSKAENLASSSLQDGATKWYYFL